MMAGYFGTEMQQRLQAQAEASADFIRATPGACQVGRMMGCDDLDSLGWERIYEFLNPDHACGFRLIPSEKVDELRSRLAERDCRFDAWHVFLADRTTALAASERILARPLSDGLIELEKPSDPEGETTRRMQALMAAGGVVTLSGSFLTGACGPATTVALGDEDGNVVATAHSYLPHNAHSPYHRYAWGGLVAVAESARGKGLGKYINARMIVGVFRDLDATHIYELVAATNLASRRMVEACGLSLEPAFVCGIATPSGSARFTR